MGAATVHAAGISAPMLAMVCVCFFVTGASGLIYQVIWNRTLLLLMGNTAHALSTLLTVFMGGLALGAWLGGRFAPTGRRALIAYGLLELAVGGYCLLLPTLIEWTDPLFGSIYRNYYQSLLRFNLIQSGIVGGLLLFPTTLMGATLPVLTRLVVSRPGVMSRAVGGLYALNSGGAFVGVMLAGFVLLPRYGMQVSYYVAIAASLGVGAVCLALAMRLSPAAIQPASSNEEHATATRPGRSAAVASASNATAEFSSSWRGFNPAVLLFAFGLSGFAAMVYEVAWTRALSISIGSNHYAFSLIVGAFIFGLSLGALVLGWIGDSPRGRYVLALLPFAIALTAIWTVFELGDLTVETTRLYLEVSDFGELIRSYFWEVFRLFLIPTLCMGGMLPIVSRHLSQHGGNSARAVGSAYGANAIGTILGSFFAGFVLISWVGMRSSILIGALISAVVGAVLVNQAFRDRKRAGFVVGMGGLVVVAVAVVYSPTWERSLISTGPLKWYLREKTGGQAIPNLRERLMDENIIYYKEGISTLVTVAEDRNGNRSLNVGGRTDGSSREYTGRWMGDLPMLLRPGAGRVLVVGLGAGWTLSSVLRHPGPTDVDCVEISEAVVDAARTHFGSITGAPLDDNRVHLIVGDGRLHLQHTDRRYDVIVSQPANPWLSGGATLFTRECFQLMKERLESGGIACVWFQGSQIPVEAFRTICATFGSVWSHSSIWLSRTDSDFLFIGSEAPLRIDFAKLAESFADPAVAEEMNQIFVPTPVDMVTYLITADSGVLRLAEHSAMNTDDNLRVSYDTPRRMWIDRKSEILGALHSVRTDPWQFVHRGGVVDGDFDRGRAKVAQFLADQVLVFRARSLAGDESVEERRRVYQAVLGRNPLDPIAGRELIKLPAP